MLARLGSNTWPQVIHLPRPPCLSLPKCWDYRPEPPCPAKSSTLFVNTVISLFNFHAFVNHLAIVCQTNSGQLPPHWGRNSLEWSTNSQDRNKSQFQPGQEGETPFSNKNTKISQALWRMPVVPATQEAETGELLESRR